MIIMIYQHKIPGNHKDLVNITQLKGLTYGADFNLFTEINNSIPIGYACYTITKDLSLIFIGANFDSSD